MTSGSLIARQQESRLVCEGELYGELIRETALTDADDDQLRRSFTCHLVEASNFRCTVSLRSIFVTKLEIRSRGLNGSVQASF